MNADRCSFCGSEQTKGGMGARDKRFHVVYCREHTLHAHMLWAQYQYLTSESGIFLPELKETD